MTTAELLANPRVQAALRRIERRQCEAEAIKHYEALAVAASKIGVDPEPDDMSSALRLPLGCALPAATKRVVSGSTPITHQVAA